MLAGVARQELQRKTTAPGPKRLQYLVPQVCMDHDVTQPFLREGGGQGQRGKEVRGEDLRRFRPRPRRNVHCIASGHPRDEENVAPIPAPLFGAAGRPLHMVGSGSEVASAAAARARGRKRPRLRLALWVTDTNPDHNQANASPRRGPEGRASAGRILRCHHHLLSEMAPYFETVAGRRGERGERGGETRGHGCAQSRGRPHGSSSLRRAGRVPPPARAAWRDAARLQAAPPLLTQHAALRDLVTVTSL